MTASPDFAITRTFARDSRGRSKIGESALPILRRDVTGTRLAPADRRDRLVNSARIWLGCVAFLAVVNLYIAFVGGGLEKDPRIGLFSWPSIAIFGVAGAVGVWLSHRTGFPAAWDSRISNRERLVYPILVGLAFGVALVAHDLLFHWTDAFRRLNPELPSFNALGPFPGPLLFYSGGAIIVEVFYRLLPIPLLLWLISNLALRGRAQDRVFLVLAALTSLIEPATQDLIALQRSELVAAASAVFVIDYVLNFAQAILFRRYGFLASILLRVAAYAVWHVIYGNYVCGC